MIPSGIGGAYHTMTTEGQGGRGVDLHSSGAGNARHQYAQEAGTESNHLEVFNGTAPGATPPSPSFIDDPTSAGLSLPIRRVITSGLLPGDDLSLTQRRLLGWKFHSTATDTKCLTTINERPSELWIEFEVYTAWSPDASTTNATQWSFFRLITSVDALTPATLQNIYLIQRWSAGALQTGYTTTNSGTQGFGFTPWAAAANNAWHTYRIYYKASTNPGTATDGTLSVYSAPGSHNNGDTLTFTLRSSITNHKCGAIDRIQTGAQNRTAYNAGYQFAAHTRNLYYTRTNPGSLTVAKPWIQNSLNRPHIGIQTASAQPGKMKVRIWGQYDRGQWGAETVDVTATVQYRDSSGGPDNWGSFTESSTGAITVDPAGRYIWVDTLDGAGDALVQNSTYYVRVKYVVDGLFEYFTGESIVRTMSATVPGVLTLLSGSCIAAIEGSMATNDSCSPLSAFDAAGAENPHRTDILGDLRYIDGGECLSYSPNPATYVALGANAAARTALVSDYFEQILRGNSQIDKVCCNGGLIWTWDDHEVQDNWVGAGTDTDWLNDFTAGDPLTLLEETESVYNQYGSSRTFANNPTQTTNTVHYDRATTAKTEIVTIDHRRFVDGTGANQAAILASRTTILGATQLAWLLDICTNTTKSIVVLYSPCAWHRSASWNADSGWGSNATTLAERNSIMAALEANAAVKTVVLIAGDRHYVSVNRAEFAAYPKVMGSYILGGWNQYATAVTDDQSTTVFKSTLGHGTSNPAQTLRCYLRLTIRESTDSVMAEIVNGENGGIVYSQTDGMVGTFRDRDGMRERLLMGVR